MMVIVTMIMVMIVMLIKWVIVTIVQQALRYIRLAALLLPSKLPQTKSLQLVKQLRNSKFTISEML